MRFFLKRFLKKDIDVFQSRVCSLLDFGQGWSTSWTFEPCASGAKGVLNLGLNQWCDGECLTAGSLGGSVCMYLCKGVNYKCY